MPNAAYGVLFVVGTAVSLSASWLLVSRLERIGEQLRLSEALLGLIAAVAADMPEMTSAVSAISSHERSVGAGVVIGSNLFNLAALIGLSAVVAGGLALHRRVVTLLGGIGLAVALLCELAVAGAVPIVLAVVVVAALVGGYGYFAAIDVKGCLAFRSVPPRWRAWLAGAIAEEDEEVETSHPRQRARRADYLVGLAALVVVVAASVVMERSASTLGARWRVSGIVTGAVVLAAVTSLPNAVTAVYLARRGRATAVLSAAFNSNAVNVLGGLLLPGAVLGLGRPSVTGTLVAGWYLALTAAVLALAYAGRGLGRSAGAAVVGAYGAFLVALLGVDLGHARTAYETVPAAGAALAMGAAAAGAARSRRRWVSLRHASAPAAEGTGGARQRGHAAEAEPEAPSILDGGEGRRAHPGSVAP